MAKIAFIGTGLMGAPMSTNLCRAGHDVTVWNRTRSKAEAVENAVVADTPAKAIKGAEFIISILSDGPASLAVQQDSSVRAAFSKGQIWIEMASIKPREAQAQAADLDGFGVAHLDAPVSGGTAGAEAGTLAIMVGGKPETFDASEKVLKVMGNPVLVGPSGSGQMAKLANQSIVAITIGAVAEAMLLLERGGTDPAAVRRALKGGFVDSTILQLHGQRMTERDFTPRGRSDFQVKDLDNVLDAAAPLGLTLPLTEALRDRFAHLCDEMGQGFTDHSALFLELLERNLQD